MKEAGLCAGEGGNGGNEQRWGGKTAYSVHFSVVKNIDIWYQNRYNKEH